MNAQFASLVGFLCLAFVLPMLGPADGNVALYVVGGADCNHSDIVEHNCIEINNRKSPCENEQVGASSVQTCLDENVTKNATVCQQTNCQNATKDLDESGSCKKIGCGS